MNEMEEIEMDAKECMQTGEQLLLHTYNRYSVVLEKGEGVYLYDINGKKYLDMAAGIAVFALGYHQKEYDDALKGQIDKLIHTSNLFYHIPAAEAAKKITKASGMDRVFFTNSGAEAIEGAIKLAIKYAYKKDGRQDHEVIAMNHSFHGRTIGALSVTGNPKYQEAFQPLLGNVVFAEFNQLESVRAAITDKTAAILLETVQGEGGIYPATEEFMQGVRKLCDEHGILMICDEIQCGMGRTGSMFAYQDYGVVPDIVTSAKALGCGVPVGAFLAVEKVAQVMVPGDHGSTYGGNPLVTKAVSTVFDLFESMNILENVKTVSKYLEEQLEQLTQDYEIVAGHRGKGLMQGLLLNIPVGPVIQKAMEKGLIVISAGNNVLRIVPPLIITKEHVDEMITILCAVFDEMA